MTALADLARLGRRLLATRERSVVAHLVRVEGSHYRRPGARAILSESGESAGAISPGCLEADLSLRIPDVVGHGRAILVEYDSSRGDDAVSGLGLACGGRLAIVLTPLDESVIAAFESAALRLDRGETVRIETHCGEETFVEEIEPPLRLLLCGAGADTASLLRQAALLDWRVSVAAPRVTAAAARRFSPFGIALHGPRDLGILATHPRCAAVVMTHNFEDDLEMLRHLVGRPLRYLGILGPRERTRRLSESLDALLPAEILHAPAGLDVGAETPKEIALAVSAKIQAALRRRPGGSLNDRRGPIHERVSAPLSV